MEGVVGLLEGGEATDESEAGIGERRVASAVEASVHAQAPFSEARLTMGLAKVGGMTQPQEGKPARIDTTARPG